MFVGHYGPSFAGKALKQAIPLWVLFVAVQFLDVLGQSLYFSVLKRFVSCRESPSRVRWIFTTCRIPTAWTELFFGRWLRELYIGCSAGQMVGVPLPSYQPLSSLTGSLICLFTDLTSRYTTTA